MTLADQAQPPRFSVVVPAYEAEATLAETIDAILSGTETVVSLKPQFLLDGLGAVHSEFVRISFTKTENPNKPGPVLITSQTSRDQPGADSYKYLLQPNLLLR